MIDLNRTEKKEEETPMSVIIMILLPMVTLFWMLIEWGL